MTTESALPRLEGLQRWMQAVISHPEGAVAGARSAEARSLGVVDIPQAVAPSQQLTAEQRIGIYADMVKLRFLEILQDDFPALRALLGSDRFDHLARGYLVAHPSRHYSLNVLGRRMAHYLGVQAEVDLEHRGFAIELATLEDAIEAVFDEAGSTPVTPEDLERIPQEAWSGARLELAPVVRLFAFDHPVNRWYQTYRDGRVGPAPAAERTWLMLYRRDFKVWRADLQPEQHAILAALAAGRSLSEALADSATTNATPLADLAPRLGPWFQHWAGLGLFTSIDTGTDA